MNEFPNVVAAELLQALAGETPTATPTAAGQATANAGGERFDIDGFIQRHGLEVDGPESWNGQQGPGRRWTFRRSVLCEHHGDGPYVLQHASGAVTAGCHHDSCKGSWGWSELRQMYELGSFDRYAGGSGGGDSANWLSVHNGESLIVDRKTGPTKVLFVPQAYVSVCGGIQPAILNRALGIEHRESGLAARLLLTCPPRRPKHWTDADIDPAAEGDLARLLARLYELQPTTGDDGQPAPVYVGMTGDAKRLWVEFYNAHGQEAADLSGELAAAWSKLEGYTARLALLVHYARWAADDSSLQHPDRIDADSMARAIQLAARSRIGRA